MSRVGCWCPWFLRNVSVLLLCAVTLSFAYLLKHCSINSQENRSRLTSLHIQCDYKRLVVVPDGIPRGVTSLSLSSNQIPKINKNDFRYLSNLTRLRLSFNEIALIEDRSFIDLGELRNLEINRNYLTNLSNHLFEGLWKLSMLDLSTNKIMFISPSAFGSMPSLRTVLLSENHLIEMADIQLIFQLPNIDYIEMGLNSFTSFETKYLPLNMSSSLRDLKLMTKGLTIFSIATPVFPHLEKISFQCDELTDMKVKVPKPRFFRNVTYLYSLSCTNLQGMIKLLDNLVSLVHLELNNGEKWISRRLLKTACSIPSLRTLVIHFHSVVHIGQELALCSELTKLDLYHNHISNLSSHSLQSMTRLRYLSLSGNHLTNVHNVLNALYSLEILDLCANNIAEIDCFDFFNLTRLEQLDLTNNHIDQLDGCVFQSQTNLKVLNLSRNLLMKVDDTFKIALKKLEFLDLSENIIHHFGSGDFKSLESLRYLTLDSIKDEHSKVLEGLYNLTSLSLSLPLHMENILSGLQCLSNLTVYLDIPEDFKGVDPHYYKSWMNLPSLRYLDVICRGTCCSRPFHVAIHFLKLMTNLEHLTANNLHLDEADKDTFISTPQLKSLAIRDSGLLDLNPELFWPISKLEVLDLSINNLKSLDFLAQANLVSLSCLILTENKLAVINDNIVHFLPALTYLDVTENPLICDCSNSGFLQWALSSVHTQVSVGPGNKCTYPVSKKGTMLLDMDLNSCWMDTSFLCCVSTAGLVLLTVLVAFGSHFLRWRLVYAYYRLVTSRYDARRRKGNEVYRYDAFISYNVRDEAWVHREMLPALEAERDWRLCLHHRDFQPGRSIAENVTEAIYGSRKTVCVISRHYLASEWCSREIQMASHRLLDEKKDVLILLFLEELSELQLSPYYRMRRLVRRSSYLSWPRAARHPQLFWQNVHRALESGDDSHGDHHHHGDGHQDNDAHFLSGPFRPL